MNTELIPGALVLFSLNLVGFFLVDRYCDFFYKYGGSFLGPKELPNWLWFRKTARFLHIVFCVLALMLPFLLRDVSE